MCTPCWLRATIMLWHSAKNGRPAATGNAWPPYMQTPILLLHPPNPSHHNHPLTSPPGQDGPCLTRRTSYKSVKAQHARKATIQIPVVDQNTQTGLSNVQLATCARLPPPSRRLSLSRPFPESSFGRTFNHFFTVTASLTLRRLRKQRLLGPPVTHLQPAALFYSGSVWELTAWHLSPLARLLGDQHGQRSVHFVPLSPPKPLLTPFADRSLRTEACRLTTTTK
jgi:hypothetical protein